MLLKKALFFYLLFAFVGSIAWSTNGEKQIHLREGIVLGSYDGVVTSELSTTAIFDLEYEVFLDNTTSYFIRSMMTMDFDKSAVDYQYLGGGMKYYFLSKGMFFNTITKGTGIVSMPRWRFFAGWAIGTSTVRLQDFGELLQVSSSTFEVGGQIGTIYQVWKSLGVELQYSADVSTGFTSVSVGGSVHRIMFGITYFL
jgi:hypothetical protein